MRTKFGPLVLWLVGVCVIGMYDPGRTRSAEPPDEVMLPPKFRKLLPLHTRLGKPRKGDWLESHPEPGQTFRQYMANHPVKVSSKRRVIYVQPLGEFAANERKIIELTAAFMEVYFSLPVTIREDLPLSLVPETAQRVHSESGNSQILTSCVLNEILKPRLPSDAVTMIAFTNVDLWPGKNWNYVFGMASLGDRVGVWSTHRFGDPNRNEEAFDRFLRRTLKTATHETGHMFSMPHCTAYECNMCGCNHLEEADRLPLWLCPHCLAKLCYATGADPEKRYKKLIDFCKKYRLKAEQAFYEKSLAVLRKK